MTVQINGDTGVSLVQDNTIQTADIVNGAVTADKLTSGSTGTAAPQKMMLMAAKATTSGTAIDFSPADSTGIPSWAKKITIPIESLSTNGTSRIQVQLGAGSIVATGYLGSGGDFGNAVVPGVGTSTTGFGIAFGHAAATTLHGRIELTKVGSSDKWVCSGVLARSDTGNMSFVAGSVTLSGTLDRIRLTTVNGTDTFDAGSVSLLIEG